MSNTPRTDAFLEKLEKFPIGSDVQVSLRTGAEMNYRGNVVGYTVSDYILVVSLEDAVNNLGCSWRSLEERTQPKGTIYPCREDELELL